MRSVLAAGLVLVAGAGALTGCSVKARDMLSAASVEADIAAQLASSYAVAPPPVHCPAAVPVQVGAKFACTTVLDGQPLRVTGEVAGARGSVTIRPTAAVVVIAAARAEIAADLGHAFHQPVGVACSAPALLVARPGRSFECTADVGGVTRHVVVTVASATGTLRLRVLPYKPA